MQATRCREKHIPCAATIIRLCGFHEKYAIITDMTDPDLITETIRDGHLVADKIRKADSISALNNLSEEVEKYCQFVNDNLGEVDEFSETQETYCELSFYLKMAVEGKERHLLYCHDESKDFGNEDVDTFEEFLDSKEWVKNSAE